MADIIRPGIIRPGTVHPGTVHPGVIRSGGTMLVVVPHPDDESFGCGSVIAHAVAHGMRVAVCAATLGEAGEVADGFTLGGRPLADVRHRELRDAAAILGADCLEPLGLLDSGWDGPPPAGSLCALDPAALTDRLASLLRAHHADVVVTLSGDDGHRDHRQLAAALAHAAVVTGTDLYEWCLPRDLMQRWADEMTRLRPDTAHLALDIARLGTPAEEITDVLDTGAQLPARRDAIAAHASQTSPYDGLSAELAEAFLTRDHLRRR